METMHDTVLSHQNHHEVDMIDVLNVIQPRQVDPPTSVNTADEETKMDRDIPQPQQGIRQAIEGEEMNDLPLDTESSKTHNMTTYVDIPTRNIYIEDTGSKAIPLERMYLKENPSDGETQMEELHMTSSQMNTMQKKKLKTEREDPATRERKRSKMRLKTTHK